MNKVMHGVVLVVFGAACWLLSVIVAKMPLMVLPAAARLRSAAMEQVSLPAFTRLCMAAGPVVLAVFVLGALVYCIYVWVRKAGSPVSWTGFLATTMSGLVLVLLPTIIAIYLPLVDFLNRLAPAVPK